MHLVLRVVVAPLVLVACGGGEEPLPAPAAAELARAVGATAQALDVDTADILRRTALAAGAASSVPSTVSELFDLAERTYPSFFPGHQSDRIAGALAYRFYPGSQAYLLVEQASLDVYVLGGPFGPRLTQVGNARGYLPPRTLSVLRSGTGAGSVKSAPAGIDCGADCADDAFGWDRAVTLAATPATGSLFAGWTGSCAGATRVCELTMSVSHQVTATFEVPLLAISVNGSGTVSSTGVGLVCQTTCTSRIPAGTLLTLTATAAPGWTFSGWSGACSGNGPTCVVLMNEVERPVTASFRAGN